MSIQPDDWFNRFFGYGFPFGRRSRGNYFDDMLRGFEDMRQEMEREFDRIQKEVPKDLVREFETPEGGKVREVGPFVYGYSMTIGPDGVPRVKEFGNVKSPMNRAGRLGSSMFSAEREPLSDISITDNEVRVTVELPGVPKERIKIQAYGDKVEVTSDDPKKRYHEVINIPPEANIETVKSSFNNGILEIIFKKKEKTKTKGKEIKIE